MQKFRQRKRQLEVVLGRADHARDEQQWDLAAQLYRDALDSNPDIAPIWVQYGHALKESGNLRDPDKLLEAEAAYRRAIALAPDVADHYLQLGHVLKLQGKPQEAQAAYLHGYKLDPALEGPLSELSQLGWSSHDVAELGRPLRPLPTREADKSESEAPEEHVGVSFGPSMRCAIDVADWTGISGWIWNPREPNERVSLELLDGEASLTTVVADRYRPDLEKAGIGDGRYGFWIPLSQTLLPYARHELHLRTSEAK